MGTNTLDEYQCTSHWGNGGCIRLLTASEDTSLQLMPEAKFRGLWEQLDTAAAGTASSGIGGSNGSNGSGGSGESSGGSIAFGGTVWGVPRSNLLMLQEAYGGLYRKLRALAYDLQDSHYMLKGWETKSGGPRQKTNRLAAYKGIDSPNAAEHDLRAVANWPGLLQMIEQEQPNLTAVSTTQVSWQG